MRGFQAVEALVEKSEPRCVTRDEHTIAGLYAPDIRFTYEVEEQHYTLTKHILLAWSRTPNYEKVEAICKEYEQGKCYTIWVDPQYPSVAVLNRGLHWLGPQAIVLGSLSFGIK